MQGDSSQASNCAVTAPVKSRHPSRPLAYRCSVFKDATWLNQKQFHLMFRVGLMLNALSNHEHLPRRYMLRRLGNRSVDCPPTAFCGKDWLRVTKARQVSSASTQRWRREGIHSA